MTHWHTSSRCLLSTLSWYTSRHFPPRLSSITTVVKPRVHSDSAIFHVIRRMVSAPIGRSDRHDDQSTTFHDHASPTTYHAPLFPSSESHPMQEESQVQPHRARPWGHQRDLVHQDPLQNDTNLAGYAFTLHDCAPLPEQNPQEEDNHRYDLVQRRRRRNCDRQRRVTEQITMSRFPRAVQPGGSEENITSPTIEIIPDYFPSNLQPDSREQGIVADTQSQPIQHYDEEGRFRNHQLFDARRAQRCGEHSHVMRELWPLDHQLPPGPGDVLDIQSSQMDRGRRVDPSMYWPTDHALPLGPEDADSFTAEAYPQTRLISSEYSRWTSLIQEILLSLPGELPSPFLEGARTPELGDDLDDASPPAYGSWELEESRSHR